MNNSKKTSRRRFTAEFKAKVALEAMQERQTLSDLCKMYELHPNQITQWKKQLKEQNASVFKEPSNGKDEKDKLIALQDYWRAYDGRGFLKKKKLFP